MHLIIDTETSGFFNASLNNDHPNQGRVIQLAALLLDKDFNEVAAYHTLITPTTWVISPGAESVHHISMKRCEEFGVPIEIALMVLQTMFECADVVVAHNFRFDSQMLTNEGFKFMNKKSYCTMDNSTELCKIPKPSGRAGYKWPKLNEALKILINHELVGAHDAYQDVKGCAMLYKYLIENRFIGISVINA